MDFTVSIYKQLLNSLQASGYIFITFTEYLNRLENGALSNGKKWVILRHDVDLLPKNALLFAQIQSSIGIKGSYYFRAVPESWDENIIKDISAMGHEVGYHYENMDSVAREFYYPNNHILKPHKAHIILAYNDFCENLDRLRKLVPVFTICMHGSPKSKFDNKAIWDKYDYKVLGLIGEPYYDMDFDKVFYLTDTGRRWDGWKVSVRDKVPQQEIWNKQNLYFRSTGQIINAARNNELPNQIMMTFHPQRWHSQPYSWIRELVLQSLKNPIKRWLINKRQ